MVIYTTRTGHDDLLAVCSSRIPGKHVGVAGADALGYLKYILGLDADWVVNVDEDAFVVSQSALLELLGYMQENNYDYCGMPDGGLVSIRRHNPTAMNAYFNIFHAAKIKPRLGEFRAGEHNAGNSGRHRFNFANLYAYDDFEPYYPLFFWLLKAGFKPLYLMNAMQDADGITTLLGNHKADLMLKHTWYAREWNGEHRARIQKVIDSLC